MSYRRRILASLAFCGLLTSCSAIRPEPIPNQTSEPIVVDLIASVFLKKELRRRDSIHKAKWSRTPSQALLQQVFPVSEFEGGYASLDCSVTPDRRLRNCRFEEVIPSNAGFEQAFLRLMRDFRLADDRPPIEDISTVSMLMRLRREGAVDVPCGLFCIPVPMPPAPPPSPPEE